MFLLYISIIIIIIIIMCFIVIMTIPFIQTSHEKQIAAQRLSIACEIGPRAPKGIAPRARHQRLEAFCHPWNPLKISSQTAGSNG